MIDISGLTVVYGRTRALDGVTLTLYDGITGLFGPNGAGKSTLLRVLAGLLRPNAGRVRYDGAELSARDEALRARVGYAGHQPGLYGRLTVRENLQLFARLHGAPMSNVDSVLARLGLDRRAEQRVEDLSAGFVRRAAVARALVHDPDLLLLDEPYANLDDAAADALSATVVSWHRPGRIAVIATHGAKRVKPFADASLILQRGAPVSYRRRVEAETGV